MADENVAGVAQAPPGSVTVLTEGKQPGQGNQVAEAPQPEPQSTASHPEPEPAEEMDWQKEALSLRKENKRWRDRTHEAETRYENAKKVFPNIDEMTPEQLASTVETERAARQELEVRLRDMQLDATLRSATQKHGVDHDLTVAFLEREGILKDVDVSAPDASQVLSDLVADIKVSKPQLAVAPGAAPVSGSGQSPGVTEPTSAVSQTRNYETGNWDDYLRQRREGAGTRAGNGSVSLVTLNR